MAWERVMQRHLTGTLSEWLRNFARPFDSYRPELYYMRGPGPKWHAKRAAVARSAPAAAREATATLKIAEARA
jgi:hypothetical protein